MRGFLSRVDGLLRMTDSERHGPDGGAMMIDRIGSCGSLALVGLALAAIYGFFMGWYSVGVHGWDGLWFTPVVMLKLPALFLLTLVITVPSLYVFGALFGLRLGFVQTVKLLLGSVAVTLAIAASLGPVLGFFTLSTESYAFMRLLNVALLGLSGVIGLWFLFRMLRAVNPSVRTSSRGVRARQGLGAALLYGRGDRPPKSGSGTAPEAATGGASPLGGDADETGDRLPFVEDAEERTGSLGLFIVWTVMFGLVGAQTGWILRPFIGSPDQPLALFRPRQGSIFTGIGDAIVRLVSG